MGSAASLSTHKASLSQVAMPRRGRERLAAKGMYVEMFSDMKSGEESGAPCIVLDVSMKGIGLLCDRPLDSNDEVFLNISYGAEFVRRIPGVVRHTARITELIWRAGIEFDVTALQYKLASQQLSSIEVKCIEKGLYFSE